MVERLDEGMSYHFESRAQIIPDRDAKLVAGLGETEECIAAIATNVAPGPCADFPPGDVTTDVILRTVGVERDLRPVQHDQQFSLVGMQPCQQAVQRDKAGAALEDAVEAGAQGPRPALAGGEPVSFEAGVEVPDQPTDQRLRGTMAVIEGVQLVYEPLRMHPAQRVTADGELPGVIAQHHGVAQKSVRLDAAPQSAFGG